MSTRKQVAALTAPPFANPALAVERHGDKVVLDITFKSEAAAQVYFEALTEGLRNGTTRLVFHGPATAIKDDTP